MAQLQPKQINKMLVAYIGLSAFLSSAAATDNLTATLTTALTTASNSGGAVPLQTGALGTQAAPGPEGIDLVAADDFLPIFKASTKDTHLDAAGNDVFGTLALAASVWTLSYWSNIAGVKTAYTFAVATSIDIEVPYWFTFDDLPANSLVGLRSRHVGPENPAVPRIQTDNLVATALNTLPNLSRVPTGLMLNFNIDGHTVSALQPGSGITVAGQVVTIAPALLLYNVAIADQLFAQYTY